MTPSSLQLETPPQNWAAVRAHWAADTEVNQERLCRVTLRLFRVGQWLESDRRTGTHLPRKVWRVAYGIWSTLMGIELPATVEAGPRLRLRHGGRGVVVHPAVVIGAECTIFHGVTIGVRRAGETRVPVIGDRVKLSVGCVVLGDIEIGDDALVGANAVAIDHVPAEGVVVPAPARLITSAVRPPA